MTAEYNDLIKEHLRRAELRYEETHGPWYLRASDQPDIWPTEEAKRRTWDDAKALDELGRKAEAAERIERQEDYNG